MIKLSKLADYGTLILVEMATLPEQWQSAADLAIKTHLPQATVSKLLKRLAGHGILISKLGKQGGYRLKQSPHHLPVLHIIEALDGPFGITECSHTLHECNIQRFCHAKPHWQKINQVILRALQHLTLANLAKQPAEKGQKVVAI